jgi:membrane protein YqaA with SNARE-associated domain
VLKSVALVLEFGGHLSEPERSHDLATTAERQVARPSSRAAVRAALAVLAVASITAVVLVAPIDYEALGSYGYLGVFLVTLITTGAFVLPVPYLAVIFKAATFLDPLAVALVAGLAAAIGELSGYLLGFGGRELLGRTRWERASERWMQRHGFLTISILAFIPNPVFDAAGIAAGALRYPAWRFALACFAGKTLKFILVAAFGSHF